MIEVACRPDGGGWSCLVTVGDDPGATRHRVTVSRETLGELAPGGATAERLVEASFEFMLEREPRESILREFDLPLIGRYFPEYPRVIGERLGG